MRVQHKGLGRESGEPRLAHFSIIDTNPFDCLRIPLILEVHKDGLEEGFEVLDLNAIRKKLSETRLVWVAPEIDLSG